MSLTRFILVLLCSISAVAADATNRVVYYPVQSIVGVEKIRSDLLEIKAQVEYPSGCYKPESFFAEVDSDKSIIYLSHLVSKTNNFCIQKIVNTLPSFVINERLNGVYRVVDKSDGRTIAEVELSDL